MRHKSCPAVHARARQGPVGIIANLPFVCKPTGGPKLGNARRQIHTIIKEPCGIIPEPANTIRLRKSGMLDQVRRLAFSEVLIS